MQNEEIRKQEEIQNDEETETKTGKLEAIDKMIDIVAFIVAVIMVLVWVHDLGYRSGVEETSQNYEIGVHDGAALTSICNLLMLRQDIPDHKKEEITFYYEELCNEPDQEAIREFIDYFLEEFYQESVEIDL